MMMQRECAGELISQFRVNLKVLIVCLIPKTSQLAVVGFDLFR